MHCDAFLEYVDALLDGRLTGSDRDEALEHLEACADCRGLFAALAARDEAFVDPSLSDAILARTSGAACASAQSRLCARLDGELDSVEFDLVNGHLRHCLECAGLARALEQAQEELPRLATLDPGPWFVERVLARTSRRPRRDPLGEKVASVLSRLFDRPRIALEGAFVATFVLVAPILAPGSPLADIPNRAVELTRESSGEPRRAFAHLGGAANEFEATLAIGARDVIEDSVDAASGFARRSTNAWSKIRLRLGTLPVSAASGQRNGGPDTNDRTPDAVEEKRR